MDILVIDKFDFIEERVEINLKDFMVFVGQDRQTTTILRLIFICMGELGVQTDISYDQFIENISFYCKIPKEQLIDIEFSFSYKGNSLNVICGKARKTVKKINHSNNDVLYLSSVREFTSSFNPGLFLPQKNGIDVLAILHCGKIINDDKPILNQILVLEYNSPKIIIVELPEFKLTSEEVNNIVDLLSIAYNKGHTIIINTHSPYILSSINILLYAYERSLEVPSNLVEKIVLRNTWINHNDFVSFFINSGKLISTFNEGLIDNGVNEGGSAKSEKQFKELLELK